MGKAETSGEPPQHFTAPFCKQKDDQK